MERIITTVRIVEVNGEWIVRAYDQDGRRWPECDYFTDDVTDAYETADYMLGHQ